MDTHKRLLIVLGLLALTTLVLTYANHFNNGFYFDDVHTIVNNASVRSLNNIPRFFTDVATFGTMPDNRGYRPMVTTLNTLDYWLAGGTLNPFYFHLSIFTWYVLQCLCLFFLFKKIFHSGQPHVWNEWFAFFAVVWYAHHTANAETINYIIARSDSFSTFCMVLALLLYTLPPGRKYFLYLIPAVIGLLTKEVAVVLPLLLFFYIAFFDYQLSLIDIFTLRKWKVLTAVIVRTAPAIMAVFTLFFITLNSYGAIGGLVSGGGDRRWYYLLTQLHVITAHYLGNFFLPLALTVDPDFQLITTPFDARVVYGFLVFVGLLTVAVLCSRQAAHRPIAFGILWFYISLLPTSSLHPLTQTANDHRTFLPYIGLVMACAWTLRCLALRYEETLRKTLLLRLGVPVLLLLFVAAHAYGARQRNAVWQSSETLWYDGTVKSPNNGRALMNYGLTQMAKGDFQRAKAYFERALTLLPYYSYLHVNLGVLHDAMGDPKTAEQYFLNALRYNRVSPESYYYYARWLHRHQRTDEAIKYLRVARDLSPDHVKVRNFLNALSPPNNVTVAQQIQSLKAMVSQEPTPEGWLDLGLVYFQAGDYAACIASSYKALELNPRYALAYNNICSAYNRLHEWGNAIQACEKALAIAPEFALARNNLRLAQAQQADTSSQ